VIPVVDPFGMPLDAQTEFTAGELDGFDNIVFCAPGDDLEAVAHMIGIQCLMVAGVDTDPPGTENIFQQRSFRHFGKVVGIGPFVPFLVHIGVPVAGSQVKKVLDQFAA
jgi:hypothetical protein